MRVADMTLRQIVEARIRILLDTALKPTFLTWVLVFVAMVQKGQPFDIAFYGFTCALIGVKRYFDVQEAK